MAQPARTIVLTGATRGTGRALVDRFVEAGHTLIACGRSVEQIAELAERHHAPHSFASVDVSDAASVTAWARGLIDANVVPDLLINNAAIINTPAPLWEVPAEEFDRLLAINVSGVANVVRAFVPAMIARGRGVIVNISSGWGRSTAPDVGPYCASKFAVEGFSGSLAQELPAGLSCVALNPGLIDTAMLRTCLPAAAQLSAGPEDWSRRAAPYLLGLGPEHNGRSLSLA
jgi:NAD(P)-dependent dehydrogenase (short-subunit alcohol dehydrogenase family)